MFGVPRSLLWTIVYSKLIYIAIFVIVGICVTAFNQNTDILFDAAFHRRDESDSEKTLDAAAKLLLAGFVRWDAVYFASIAAEGYRFEQQYAFFPLLPLAMKCGSWLFFPASLLVSKIYLRVLAGVLLVNASHVAAALVLYRLTRRMFRSERFAQLSALLFAWSPASAFLTAVYSEAPFALCTFAGLLAHCRRQRYRAALFWCLAAALRSNGLLLGGFFAFDALSDILHRRRAIRPLVASSVRILTVSTGFLATVIQGYYNVCTVHDRPWCHRRFPNIYSFVQDHYWNVGFLRYFVAGNIPNFLLAAPMIILGCCCIFEYTAHDPMRMICLTNTIDSGEGKKRSVFLSEQRVLPHIVLLAFMLVYSLLFVHVQIVTRIFTFMPVIPWYMAHLLLRGGPKWPVYLFTAYGLLNSILFSAYYPPA